MRFLLVCLLSSLYFSVPARAQLAVTGVRVGFRGPELANRNDSPSYFKAGAWTPVFVDVEGGPDGSPAAMLFIETTDSADVRNRFPVSVPRLEKGQRTVVTGYARPGCLGARIRVTALDSSGRRTRYLGEHGAEALDFDKHLILVVGSSAAGLEKAALHLEADPKKLRVRWTASATAIDQLPERWFGYEAVDLLILTTGDRAFLKSLLDDNKGRKEALGEWVRRGGRLFLSIAPENAGLVLSLLKTWKPGPPPVVTGLARHLPPPDHLRNLVTFAEAYGKLFQPDPSGIQVANLRVAGPRIGPVEVIAQEGPSQPLVLRFSYGLGSATLLAIDLAREPFTSWEGQDKFWVKLLTLFGPKPAQEEASRSGTAASNNNDLATDLQREMEVFPNAEPVPFGLVAVLIFLYIMLIGPLDYLFLKRVLKRLEWTWITYPLLIVGVSVAAFFAAASTGPGLQINKVDLLDIDAQDPLQTRVRGTAWVTFYSPTMQSVDLAVEPAAPAWARVPEGSGKVPAVVAVFGRPESGGLNSTGRRQPQSPFLGHYDYAPDAAGILALPMPHASTRAFTASWEAAFPRPLAVDLTYDPQNPERLSGSIVNHLPVEILDPALFYGGKWYDFFGSLTPGQGKSLTGRAFRDFAEWSNDWEDTSLATGGDFHPDNIVKTILFQDKLPRGINRRNNVYRHLDQSWRLRLKDQEAILVGRLPQLQGSVEEVAGAPGCPSRLWLGTLPGKGVEGELLSGTMTQVTYLRVYLLVKPGTEKPVAD